jgi:hypothetical protein
MNNATDNRQTTGVVMMIRPAQFSGNLQTSGSNAFQRRLTSAAQDLRTQARHEFDNMTGLLRNNGISVLEFEDTEDPAKPDAVFPNNWTTFHGDGSVILYPMYAPNRRLEIRADVIEALSVQHGFNVTDIIDLSFLADHEKFLEGTGSMVLDRVNNEAYACLSSRTHMDVLAEFSQRTGYSISIFDAIGPRNLPVYHTNVMMCIGQSFSLICPDVIIEAQKRRDILSRLRQTGRRLIEISPDEMGQFAGNLLELKSIHGFGLLVISKRAYHSLSRSKLRQLEKFGQVLPFDIDVIETAGGGSVRCMMAEVFLPRTGRAEN